MHMKHLGNSKVDFVNERGERIKGRRLFLAYKDNNVEGLRTDTLFIQDDIVLPEDLKVNDVLDISFTNKAKVESITKA